MEDKSLTDEEAAALTADLESAEDLDDAGPARPTRGRKVLDAPAEAEPRMTSPEWPAWVMKHFAEDELDKDGHPLVTGLRRVSRLLLGPVLESSALPFQAPQYVPGLEKVGVLQPTTVGYRVRILMCRTEDVNLPAYEVTFQDVADVYFGNTDEEFARHASASASTKAEARCLRKALQLKGVAAEEKTVVPAFEAAQDGKIQPNQVNFITQLCRRNDINVTKFVNMGRSKYESLFDVPCGTAAKMIEHLSELQRDPGKVPAGVKGYDDKWRAQPA